jgi:hypothetical protein
MKILDEDKNLIEVRGLVYEATHKTKSCSGCAFLSSEYSCTSLTAPCFASVRPDGKYVIFKLKEESK